MNINDLARDVQALVRPYLDEPALTPFDHYLSRVKISHPGRGLIDFRPYETQTRLFRLMDAQRGIVSTCRQAGNTTGMRIKVLYDALHNPDHTTMWICGNSRQAQEIQLCLASAYSNESYKSDSPDITMDNRGLLKFSNGSKIYITTLSHAIQTRLIAHTEPLDRLVIDDAAFLSHGHLAEFWNEIQRYLTSSSKVIMVSCQNVTDGLFYQLWQAGYPWRKMLIQWWELPGRDEVWEAQQFSCMDEPSFNQSHCGVPIQID